MNNPVRSFCIIMACAVISAFLFAGTILTFTFSDAEKNIADRLGADIMIVPAGYDPHLDNILLSGKPSAFYLPETALDDVKSLGRSDIAKISPQVFMATLRASCCAYPVQIMGIDCESDFIIRAWLDTKSQYPLNDGEIILGCHNAGNIGDEVVFFGIPLKVSGRLERTGLSIDSSVFMNRNTIINLAKAADKIKSQKLAENENLMSVIMLKLKPGIDVPKVARDINRSLGKKGIYALFSKRFAADISSSLNIASGIMKYSLVLLWLPAAIITVILFALYIILRRKDETARPSLILQEALIMGIFGALAGIILGGIITFAGSSFIVEALNLPGFLR